MLVTSDVAADARVVREATTLAEAGYAVHVIGKDVPADWAPPAGITVSSAGGGSGLRRADADGARRQLPPHLRAARWTLLPQHRNTVHRSWLAAARADASRREFDIVHAHDFNTLELGTELAAVRGARLVYDSHEFWSGRPRHGRPTPYQRSDELRSERRLGRQADAVLTVSHGIAALFRQRFRWANVTVVRNSFPLPAEPPQPPSAPGGAVYAGRIAAYRELEIIAAAAPVLKPLRVTLAGPADETYLAGFRAGPVTVRPTMPLAEVEALITSEGLALVTHSNRWVNHRLALPNKLFLAVRAGVPVIATDVDELASCVRAYGIGTLYRPGDAAGLVAAARTVVARYDEYVGRVREAAPALSWQSDGAALLGVYAGLGRP